VTQLLEIATPSDIPKRWPTTAHHFTGRLRRAAAGLRALGIDVDFARSAKKRTMTTTYSPNVHPDEDLLGFVSPETEPF
jgi:hypothetical protein